MKTISTDEARAVLPELLDQATISHEPIKIFGESASAVLISEDDWRSIEETLYLLSIPGMRDSIKEGISTPPEECSSELNW